MDEALVRECQEETGIGVRIGRLLFIRDYIAKNHEFADEDGDAHQLELMFACAVVGSADAALGSVPDSMQIGVAWVPLEDLRNLRLYPRAITDLLVGGVPDGDPVYLGDVN